MADIHRLPKNRSRRTTAIKSGFAWLEMLLALSVFSLVLQFSWPSLERWQNRPRAGRQVEAFFEGETGSLGYLIYLPDGYDKLDQSWPLFLFLHGGGGRGHDLEKVRARGPASMIDSGRSFPMIVVSPQCSENSGWRAEPLLELLDEIGQRFDVDSSQVFVTGYSMGGYGTWTLAAANPERFAAAAPVCGGGDVNKAEALAKLPIWAFHGAQDKVIPLKASQEMADAIQAAGGDVRLTVYPDKDHGISKVVYNNDDLYEWLSAQKRLKQGAQESLSVSDHQ